MLKRDSEAGNRDYVRVLRLLEIYGLEDVEKGLYLAFDQGIFSLEGIKHLILGHIEKRPPTLSLMNFPHIPAVCVQKTNPTAYMSLMGGVS